MNNIKPEISKEMIYDNIINERIKCIKELKKNIKNVKITDKYFWINNHTAGKVISEKYPLIMAIIVEYDIFDEKAFKCYDKRIQEIKAFAEKFNDSTTEGEYKKFIEMNLDAITLYFKSIYFNKKRKNPNKKLDELFYNQVKNILKEQVEFIKMSKKVSNKTEIAHIKRVRDKLLSIKNELTV